MAKIMLYDKDGKECFFNHAVDAREGIQMGFYFENPPEKAPEIKADEPVVEAQKPRGRKKSEEVVADEPVVEDISEDN